MKKAFMKAALLLVLMLVTVVTSMAQTAKEPVPIPNPYREESIQVDPIFQDHSNGEFSEKEAELLAQKQVAEQAEKLALEETLAKEKELEKAKVVNPNWRNDAVLEKQINEAKRAEVKAINVSDLEARKLEIQRLEATLLKITDEGVRTKVLNKIDNLKNNSTETGWAE